MTKAEATCTAVSGDKTLEEEKSGKLEEDSSHGLPITNPLASPYADFD